MRNFKKKQKIKLSILWGIGIPTFFTLFFSWIPLCIIFTFLLIILTTSFASNNETKTIQLIPYIELKYKLGFILNFFILPYNIAYNAYYKIVELHNQQHQNSNIFYFLMFLLPYYLTYGVEFILLDFLRIFTLSRRWLINTTFYKKEINFSTLYYDIYMRYKLVTYISPQRRININNLEITVS